MAPFYPTHNSLIEGEQDQTQLSPFTIATDHTSSFPFPFLFNTQQDRESDRDRDKPIDLLLIGEPTDGQVPFPTYNKNTIMDRSLLCDPYGKDEDLQGSGEWMSSKMRIMRKMMNSDNQIAASKPAGTSIHVLEDQRQKSQDSSCSSSSRNTNPLGVGVIRVCSDCNTTKTPLWRGGPRGPKSLCNACGIRQRKVRRAAMTAAAVDAELVPISENPNMIQKAKRTDQVDRTIPFKKRCKMIRASTGDPTKTLCFDDVKIRLGKGSSNFHRVFPQDERDAAILLMALSCGLIRS